MFIIKLTDKNGETWFHSLNSRASLISMEAHKFKNIGRAVMVARRYSKHVGKSLKGWHVGTEKNEILKEHVTPTR